MSQELNLEQTASAVSSKSIQLVAAALLGLTILSITVFAPLDVIHNATHDTRHNTGFPCH